MLVIAHIIDEELKDIPTDSGSSLKRSSCLSENKLFIANNIEHIETEVKSIMCRHSNKDNSNFQPKHKNLLKERIACGKLLDLAIGVEIEEDLDNNWEGEFINNDQRRLKTQ